MGGRAGGGARGGGGAARSVWDQVAYKPANGAPKIGDRTVIDLGEAFYDNPLGLLKTQHMEFWKDSDGTYKSRLISPTKKGLGKGYKPSTIVHTYKSKSNAQAVLNHTFKTFTKSKVISNK